MKNPILRFYGIERTQKGDYYKITLVEDREDETKKWYVAFVNSKQVTDDPTKERLFVNLNLKRLAFKEKEKETTEEADPSLPF